MRKTKLKSDVNRRMPKCDSSRRHSTFNFDEDVKSVHLSYVKNKRCWSGNKRKFV